MRRSTTPRSASANFGTTFSARCCIFGASHWEIWVITGSSFFPSSSTASPTAANTAGALSKMGLSIFAPSRPRAACIFDSDPLKVEPMLCAAPPTVPSMTSANSSKLTLPSVTILRASSAVTPYFSCSFGSRPRPRSMSWFISSVESFWLEAILVQIEPISWKSDPVIAAESPTSLSTRVRSSPSSTPAPTKVAAMDAASPKP